MNEELFMYKISKKASGEWLEVSASSHLSVDDVGEEKISLLGSTLMICFA
jgi:hypothetical protein